MSDTPAMSFLKTHERLIIIVLSLLASLYFVHRGLNAWEAHDQRTDILAHAKLQADTDAVKQIAADNAKAAAQYQTLATQLAAANKALANAQATRNAVTQTQPAADRTLPPNELGKRWAALLNAAPESIQVEPGGKGIPDALLVTPAAAIETVVQLESVPTLQADLKDEQTIATNQTTQLTSLASINVGLNKQIDALNIENVAAANACTDDKNLLKAQARKSKLHWFEAGVVVGFIGRQIIKTYTGF
jgi:hypothetical protein